MKPGGLLTVNLSFLAGPWFENRLCWTLARASGSRPVVIEHGLHGAATFIAAHGLEG